MFFLLYPSSFIFCLICYASPDIWSIHYPKLWVLFLNFSYMPYFIVILLVSPVQKMTTPKIFYSPLNLHIFFLVEVACFQSKCGKNCRQTLWFGRKSIVDLMVKWWVNSLHVVGCCSNTPTKAYCKSTEKKNNKVLHT